MLVGVLDTSVLNFAEAAISDMQIAGCELSVCRRWHEMAGMPSLHLGLANPMPPGSLARLLSSLLPAGAAPCPFQGLHLSGHVADPAAVAGCPQLSQLLELSWGACPCHGQAQCERSLAALLQQATSLRSLAVKCSYPNLGAVPPCLASYHGLTSLALEGQGLRELPAGEYLAGGLGSPLFDKLHAHSLL